MPWPPYLGSCMLPNPVVLKAFTTRAPFARAATCSPPDELKPSSSVSPGPNGLVQSIRTLFFQSRICPRTCGTAPHGTARATTSAFSTALASLAMEPPGPGGFAPDSCRIPKLLDDPFVSTRFRAHRRHVQIQSPQFSSTPPDALNSSLPSPQVQEHDRPS